MRVDLEEVGIKAIGKFGQIRIPKSKKSVETNPGNTLCRIPPSSVYKSWFEKLGVRQVTGETSTGKQIQILITKCNKYGLTPRMFTRVGSRNWGYGSDRRDLYG